MKPAPFTYVRPHSLEEALAFLADHAEEARPVAGGQSLMPMLNLRLVSLDYLVDIDRLPGLDGVASTPDGGLHLGALVRHRSLAGARLESPSDLIGAHAPLLALCALLIGHPAIRNRGTLGGSVAHADPAAELPAALVALDATVCLAHRDGERRVAAEEFFLDLFTTALRPAELVVGVQVPAPAARTGWACRELARRHGDYALVGVVARITLDAEGGCADSRLVLFGLDGAPHRSLVAENLLRGREPSAEALAAAAREATAPLDLSGDVQASAAYRKEVARVYAERALTAALRGAAGEQPPARR